MPADLYRSGSATLLASWEAYRPAYVAWLESVGVPPGLMAGVDPREFHLLTARLLHDARARGRRTASLQSTAMAEGVYRAVGFHDLGRILEFVP